MRKLPLKFIDGNLYASPMPCSSTFDPDCKLIEAYKKVNIDVVVVLAPAEELLEIYRQNGFEVIYFPIPDHDIPADKEAFGKIVKTVAEKLEAGKNVVVHCHAGIGRTGTFLVALLRYMLPEFELDELIEFVLLQAGAMPENAKQYNFIKSMQLADRPASHNLGSD